MTLIQGIPGRGRQIAMEGHHHTSTISLGNEAEKEMNGWGPVSTGKQSTAEPSHCTSQALVPLSYHLTEGSCRKGQQLHAEVFGSQWLPAWHSRSPCRSPVPGLSSINQECTGASLTSQTFKKSFHTFSCSTP